MRTISQYITHTLMKRHLCSTAECQSKHFCNMQQGRKTWKWENTFPSGKTSPKGIVKANKQHKES